MSITRAGYDRLATRLKNMKAEAKEAARLTTHSAMTVAGGAAAGVLAAKYPNLGDTEVPTAAAAGALLVGLSLTGMLDEYGDEMAALGSGMLAAVAAKATEEALLASATAKAA